MQVVELGRQGSCQKYIQNLLKMTAILFSNQYASSKTEVRFDSQNLHFWCYLGKAELQMLLILPSRYYLMQLFDLGHVGVMSCRLGCTKPSS